MPNLEDVQCDECNKILSNKQGLQRHKWRQHGEPQFESDICHEHFRDPDYLQDHHQVEYLKIPFHCVLCNKDYSSKRTLLGHNKLYHLNANSGEVFTCSHYGKQFISQGICLCLEKFQVLNVKKRLLLNCTLNSMREGTKN